MQTILITGSASGIGEAVALKMAGNRQHLILHTGSNAPGLQRVAKSCAAAGIKVDTILGDLCEAKTMDALLSAGRGANISGLVLNAGFPDGHGFETLSRQALERSMQVILSANFRRPELVGK